MVHVALTYDGSIIKLFINGSLDTTLILTGNMYTPQNNMITFGAYTWSGGTSYYYKGIIDE